MGQTQKAKQAVHTVVQSQSADGSFRNAKTSITRSCGKSLHVETTSLAVLSMLRVDPDQWSGEIKNAIDFLMHKMNGGYFGSTQATILAMKAFVEFMAVNGSQSGEAEFEVSLNNNAYCITIGDKIKHPHKGTHTHCI